jgi:tRNA-modifying protein YgfZ
MPPPPGAVREQSARPSRAAILEAMAAADTATLASEYATVTKRCGLVDRSERGKLALTGAGAVEFLNGQVTNELVGMKPGEGCYAAFLTHKGKMLGDLRILAAGEDPEGAPDELLLDTERGALQALFDMIRRFKVGYEVELHKRTIERSLFSLIGPQADEIAGRAFEARSASASGPQQADWMTLDRVRSDPSDSGSGGPSAGEHAHWLVKLEAIPVRLIRTEVGLDVLFESSAGEAVRSALAQGGAVEVSEAAAEIVRVEHGRPRYGIDLDESTIPQEAGLNERAVSFTKGCYVGQETVARLHYRGKPNRYLRGLRLSAPADTGAELRLGERSVGHLASSVVSPRLGAIGLALVRREAAPGDTIAVGDHGAGAVVSELPFG